MTFKIEQIPVGQMANFSYLIIDDSEEKETAIIDPSWNLEKVLEIIKKNKYKVKYVINTHSHFDHVLGNDQIVDITKCKVIQHKNSKEKHDISVNDGYKPISTIREEKKNNYVLIPRTKEQFIKFMTGEE